MKKELREVAVYYTNGGRDNQPFIMGVNMAAHLSDDDIREYFAAGSVFNVGCHGFDLMATVDRVEIIK